MLHVEEVPGVVDGDELAVVQVLGEQAHVGWRGVGVVFAVDE